MAVYKLNESSSKSWFFDSDINISPFSEMSYRYSADFKKIYGDFDPLEWDGQDQYEFNESDGSHIYLVIEGAGKSQVKLIVYCFDNTSMNHKKSVYSKKYSSLDKALEVGKQIIYEYVDHNYYVPTLEMRLNNYFKLSLEQSR